MTLPVAIVGAGSVRFTTALGLKHYGVPFLLFEDEDCLWTDTKAGTTLSRSPSMKKSVAVRWVNQNQTLSEEIGGDWSPKRNKNGAFNRFYENMKLLEPGDTVPSFADQRVDFVERATDRAATNPKPEFGGKGAN